MSNHAYKWSEPRAEQIVKLVREGLPRAAAAAQARISERTLRRWLDRGETGDEPFASFLRRVQEAEATCITQHIEAINKSSDWRAHAWALERGIGREWFGPPQEGGADKPYDAELVEERRQQAITALTERLDMLDEVAEAERKLEGQGTS